MAVENGAASGHPIIPVGMRRSAETINDSINRTSKWIAQEFTVERQERDPKSPFPRLPVKDGNAAIVAVPVWQSVLTLSANSGHTAQIKRLPKEPLLENKN
jgi:hypothetical protein